MLKSLIYLQLKIWLLFLISQSDKRGLATELFPHQRPAQPILDQGTTQTPDSI